MPFKDQGLVEPEEERHQWVFHVMVSGRYTDWRESKSLAGEQQDEAQDDENAQPQSISANSDPQQCSSNLAPTSIKLSCGVEGS